MSISIAGIPRKVDAKKTTDVIKSDVKKDQLIPNKVQNKSSNNIPTKQEKVQPNMEEELNDQDIQLTPEEELELSIEQENSIKTEKGELVKLKKNYSNLLYLNDLLTKYNSELELKKYQKIIDTSLKLVSDIILPNIKLYSLQLNEINNEFTILIKKLSKNILKISNRRKKKGM